MVNPLSRAARDLTRYEDLIRRFEIEQRQLQFHEEDLLSHQQDLQRHTDFIIRLQEDNRRHVESVRRLYEDNQRHANRIRSIEGIIKSTIIKSLGDGTPQPAPIQMIGPVTPAVAAAEVVTPAVVAAEEKSNSCEGTDSDEGRFGNEVDSFAAKSLMDLSAKNLLNNTDLDLVPYKEEMESCLQMDLGCRFQPTDQELIACLYKKVTGQGVPDFIKEKNLYGSEEPQDIFNGITASELYFFTLIKNKFDSGKKIDRIVGSGTWKIQNKKPIYEDAVNKSGTKIGFKKTLNFMHNSGGDQDNRNKNSWIMHEYVLNPLNVDASLYDQGKWAICRVKRGRGNLYGLEPSSSSVLQPTPVSSKRPFENVDVELHMPQMKISKVESQPETQANLDLPVQQCPVPIATPLSSVQKPTTNGGLSEQETGLTLALAPPSVSVSDIPKSTTAAENTSGSTTVAESTVSDTPKPVADTLKPVADTPKPVLEIPKSVSEIPKPVSDIPKSLSEIPKSVFEIRKPVSGIPKSVFEIRKPVSDIPKPVSEISKSVFEIRKPVSEIPKSVFEIPKAVSEISKPVPEISKPVPDIPKPVSEIPKSVSEIPKPVSEIPKPVSEIPIPKSVSEILKPASEIPKSVSDIP